MRPVQRFRERLVLGHVRTRLAEGEEIVAWSHANLPDTRAPGLLIVTDRRLLLHVATSTIPDTSTPLAELTGFDLDRRKPSVVSVSVQGDNGHTQVDLNLTSRVRSRSVGRVLAALHHQNLVAPANFDPSLTSPLPPMERGVKDHARRVWVTVLGLTVLLLSAVFASPFVPGPGALTAVFGIAILAREYEWARDLHVWAARVVERFMSWIRDLRRKRRATSTAQRAAHRSGSDAPWEATVDVPPEVMAPPQPSSRSPVAARGDGTDGSDDDPGRRAMAS